jgi:hypothetical protein
LSDMEYILNECTLYAIRSVRGWTFRN